MRLEYLFTDETQADNCVSIINQTSATPNKIVLNDNCFIVSAFLKSESDDSAKVLSKLHGEVTKTGCIVLTDECSAYYDKILYPLINEFERKLRKLLYTASAISKVGENQIANLDSMDFGELFVLLFRDDEYWKKVKTYVNGNKNGWVGFEGTLREFLDNEIENPLWDKLLSDEVPTLRARFTDVQKYRNDVMHAHNLNRDEFLKIRRLFIEINKEIDDAIENVASIPESYNDELGNAMAVLTTSDGDIITDHEGNPFIVRL